MKCFLCNWFLLHVICYIPSVWRDRHPSPNAVLGVERLNKCFLNIIYCIFQGIKTRCHSWVFINTNFPKLFNLEAWRSFHFVTLSEFFIAYASKISYLSEYALLALQHGNIFTSAYDATSFCILCNACQ